MASIAVGPLLNVDTGYESTFGISFSTRYAPRSPWMIPTQFSPRLDADILVIVIRLQDDYTGRALMQGMQARAGVNSGKYLPQQPMSHMETT